MHLGAAGACETAEPCGHPQQPQAWWLPLCQGRGKSHVFNKGCCGDRDLQHILGVTPPGGGSMPRCPVPVATSAISEQVSLKLSWCFKVLLNSLGESADTWQQHSSLRAHTVSGHWCLWKLLTFGDHHLPHQAQNKFITTRGSILFGWGVIALEKFSLLFNYCFVFLSKGRGTVKQSYQEFLILIN